MAIEELQGGRYRYERMLGSGGMGDVYLMQDTRVSRRVAIKVVRAEGSIEGEEGADATRLFQREAKAIAALEHPNILPLYDFGEEARDGMIVTYMVMPYCADGSLQVWLRKQRSSQPYAPQLVASLIEQAADALQYAHDHEVIHLDVKPSNFLLRRNRKDPQRPTLLLADFGIARNFATVASSSRTIRGTPTSMAPEQWSGSPVFASDQYALAVMTYELLAGRPPFIGSMEQLMYQHFTAQVPPPCKFNPRLPAALDAVLLRALAKKPEERFSSIADFASALVEAAQQPAPPLEEAGTAEEVDAEAISQEETEIGISRLLASTGEQEETALVAAGKREKQALRAHETPAPKSDTPVNIPVPEEVTTTNEAAREEAPAEASPATPQLDQQAPIESPAEHDLPTLATDGPEQEITAAPAPLERKVPGRKPGTLLALAMVVLVLLVVGGTSFYLVHQADNASGHHSIPTVQAKATRTALPIATPSPTPPPGLDIAGTYNGSMAEYQTLQTVQISISLIQTQGQGALHGSVTFRSSTPQTYPLSGSVDLQGNFSFTVQQPPGQLPLVFYGSFQPNTNLKGYYCRSTTNACSANAGYFTVGPRILPQ